MCFSYKKNFANNVAVCFERDRIITKVYSKYMKDTSFYSLLVEFFGTVYALSAKLYFHGDIR